MYNSLTQTQTSLETAVGGCMYLANTSFGHQMVLAHRGSDVEAGSHRHANVNSNILIFINMS